MQHQPEVIESICAWELCGRETGHLQRSFRTKLRVLIIRLEHRQPKRYSFALLLAASISFRPFSHISAQLLVSPLPISSARVEDAFPPRPREKTPWLIAADPAPQRSDPTLSDSASQPL